MAHIGVLIELERLGIYPRLITGTSVGGLVGALLAADMNTEEMVAFFQQMTLGRMYAFPGRSSALSGSNKFEKLLEKTLGRITFADLKIPLAIVTADLVSRKEIVLDEGDLISAILATTALPIVFPPIERGGLILVDGGFVNNVPFDIARARGATHVIAVDLSNTSPYGTSTEMAPAVKGFLSRVLNFTKRRSTFKVLTAVKDIITINSFNARLANSQPDILLRPQLGTIGLFDIHRWQECLEAGKAAVRKFERELIGLQSMMQGEAKKQG